MPHKTMYLSGTEAPDSDDIRPLKSRICFNVQFYCSFSGNPGERVSGRESGEVYSGRSPGANLMAIIKKLGLKTTAVYDIITI